jgi:ParB/RepB/Spo0J family partition protein
MSILPNKYKRLPVTAIHIVRDERQRKKIETDDIDDSIRERGVLQPIIVRPAGPDDNTDLPWVIVAGERRLTSSIKVGLVDIPARLGDELSYKEWQLIELEENVKRQALEWQDEVRAISRIHTILLEENEDWDAKATAKYIGMDTSSIYRTLRVARDIDNPRIAGAGGIRPAWNILDRLDERRSTDIINSIVEDGIGAFSEPASAPAVALGASPAPVAIAPATAGGTTPLASSAIITTKQQVPVPLAPPRESILNVDFLEWAPTYSGPRFNFIHMDPPYGINVFAGAMSGRKSHDTYNDDEEVYWAILKCFCDNIDRLMTPSGHLMIWFSMDYYSETLAFFAKHAPSLTFSKHPLYWTKTDNVGILPDPKRGPRRIVETALHASREDHLIVRSVSNWYGAPTDKTYHTSTKPEPMLRNFFQMFVDETTRLLDPTCGSGSALRAAESLGAADVLGIERDPSHYEAAKTALRSFRNLRKASK